MHITETVRKHWSTGAHCLENPCNPCFNKRHLEHTDHTPTNTHWDTTKSSRQWLTAHVDNKARGAERDRTARHALWQEGDKLQGAAWAPGPTSSSSWALKAGDKRQRLVIDGTHTQVDRQTSVNRKVTRETSYSLKNKQWEPNIRKWQHSAHTYISAF